MFKHHSENQAIEPDPIQTWDKAQPPHIDAPYFFKIQRKCPASKPVLSKKHPPAPHDYQKGKRVFRQGDIAHNIYDIVHGDLVLYHCDEDGKEQVIDFIGAGQLAGFTGDVVHHCTLECLTPCLIRGMPVKRYHYLSATPGQELGLLALAGSINDRHMHHITMMGRRSALERVARFLFNRHTICGHGPLVTLPMSRSHIANYLGLVTESVSRALTKLEHLGLIRRLKAHHIVIRDITALDRLANGSRPYRSNSAKGAANGR